MTNTTAILAAAFIHMFLRITIFIEPNYRGCSPQTPTSSWLFLLSILEFLWDTDFIPERYKILPPWCLWFVEIFTCVFVMEFGIIVIWCNLEKLIYRSLKRIIVTVAPKLEHPEGDILVEVVTLLTGLCVFYYVSHGTDTVYQLKKRFRQASKKLKGKSSYITGSSWLSSTSKTSCCPLVETSIDEEDGLSAICQKRVRTSTRLSGRRKKY